MGNATTHLDIANATPHRAHVVIKSPQPDGVKLFEAHIEPHGQLLLCVMMISISLYYAVGSTSQLVLLRPMVYFLLL